MCIVYLWIEEYQAPPFGPEELFEFVYRPVPMNALHEFEQSLFTILPVSWKLLYMRYLIK